MSLERVWYETSPVVYALGGVTVLLGASDTLARVSGALLVLAAATILRMRWVYRNRRREVREAPALRAATRQSSDRKPSESRRARNASQRERA
jgi:hypothetical protein